jgi:hypothetical protein
MGHHGSVPDPAEPQIQPTVDPLEIAALEIERHVASAGWDQNPRLFALVPTAALVAAEPGLDGGLQAQDLAPGALSAVEQEGLEATSSLESLLGRLAWPPEVHGTALTVERMVVPPDAERDLPEDADAALEVLTSHPGRRDIRLVVAVTRAGASVCLLRQRDHDRDDRVASGPDLAPGIVHALRATFED